MSKIVSVVMPVYNAELFLQAAIESVLGQTFSDFELFLIDDGSTDRSREILEQYKKLDSRVVCIHNPSNLGLSRSLNLAITRSNGSYIARMDADDISLPERFATQIDFLNSNPEIGVLGSLFKLIDKDSTVTSQEIPFPTVPDFVKWCFFFYNPIVHPAVMMRREVINMVGGYSSEVERSQDKDLWVRLFWKTKFSNVPKTLLYLRKHEQNVSNTGYVKGLEHNSIILGQLASELVGYWVSPECMWNIYRDEYPSDYSICNAITVILDLYDAFLKMSPSSDNAKTLIFKDVQHRIGSLLNKLSPQIRENLTRARPEMVKFLGN